MNSVQLTGRLTRDPELVQLESGSVCRLRLAVENMGRNETGYVDVSTFGKAGEAAARVLSKGWLVAVDGRLDYRHWVADDGANRSAHRRHRERRVPRRPARRGRDRRARPPPDGTTAGPPPRRARAATDSPERHESRAPSPNSSPAPAPSATLGSRRSGG